MEKTVNAIKNLRETLRNRSIELENLLECWEDRLAMIEEDNEESETLMKLCRDAYRELRANDKLMKSLTLCDYCKASDHNLCDICG